jgi:hypothetical protein
MKLNLITKATAMFESNSLVSTSSMLVFFHAYLATLNIPCRLVCELRDHTGRALATTTLRRTWGGDKPSRRSKKDANGRSGHRVNTRANSPLLTSTTISYQAVMHILRHQTNEHLSNHAPTYRQSRSRLLLRAILSPHVDLLSSPRVEPRSKSRVKAPASGPGSHLRFRRSRHRFILLRLLC